MIFIEGKKKSIEGVLRIFDDFAAISGLTISLEKSTLYLARVSIEDRTAILPHFPFAMGQLPVRYLGLPLLTKQMSVDDYSTLLERIQYRFTSWTTRFISYAGHLQLLWSAIYSLINFWIQAYRLPSDCTKEIEKMCSAFLWSGPELNTTKSKVTWEIICSQKSEGGLGLKRLKEANKVCCLKLIWRILSSKPSLWVSWVKNYILHQNSFWAIKHTSTVDS